MRIGKPLALIIGLVSLWPAIYMLLFLGFFVWTAFTILNRQPQDPGLFPYIVIPHIGTMLVMFALMSFYIVHLFKNAALKDDRRVLWAVVLFLGRRCRRQFTGIFMYGRQRDAAQAQPCEAVNGGELCGSAELTLMSPLPTSLSVAPDSVSS